MQSNSFFQDVERIVRQVPIGRVTTYGDVAALIGRPRAARQVGGAAHHGNVSVCWHRLVNREGRLASGFPGGSDVQAQLLRADDVVVKDGFVYNFQKLRMKFDEYSQ